MRTKVERETVILFNEAEEVAQVYSHNARIKNRLCELAANFPQQCKYLGVNEDGGVDYEIDKNLIAIRKPYSEERKQRDRERAIAENRIQNCKRLEDNLS